MNRILLLGIDGATFNILDPAFEAGHMPNLKKLLDRGASGVLTSTVPPYTPPGWTSIFTGVNPGKHGIFGFTLGNVQRNDGLVRLDRVKAPAIWNAVNAQGHRIGVFNVPMTYPPPVVDGFSVSGMLTPEGGGVTPDGFTYPDELAETISQKIPDYEIDIEVNYDQDWRSTDIEERLSRNYARKRAALKLLLQEHEDIKMLFPVFEAPDRVMHVHYKYIDPRCEHYTHPEAEPIRERVWSFFDEMDEVIGDCLAWAGDDGYIVTMSDHGFGPKDKTVNINLALREWGLLSVGGAGAVSKSAGVRKVARRAKKVLPKSVWKKAKGIAQSQIDWSKTKAFSAPIPQQGIYVNLEGREPNGIVPQSEYEAVRDEVIERLSALIDPDDGKPVVDRVYKREEVVYGSEARGRARPLSRCAAPTPTSCRTGCSRPRCSTTTASCPAVSIKWMGSSASPDRTFHPAVAWRRISTTSCPRLCTSPTSRSPRASTAGSSARRFRASRSAGRPRSSEWTSRRRARGRRQLPTPRRKRRRSRSRSATSGTCNRPLLYFRNQKFAVTNPPHPCPTNAYAVYLP